MSESLVVRSIARHERAAVLALLGEWISPEFFGRYFEHDPAFRDDRCFVAVDGDRIVSTLQVFEKEIRVPGGTVRVGGVGNVYTTPDYREHGTASQLLTLAVSTMEAHGLDLSLLFAVRLAFYGRHGWCSHRRLLTFIDAASVDVSGRYAIEPFVAARDLDAVMRVYDTYTANLPGTTVRDRRYWLGHLAYAGNTSEDFLVARAGGAIVAYARGTPLYDYYAVMEHGYVPGHEGALVDLVCRLHGIEARALPGTLAQLAIEPQVLDDLRGRGLTLRTIEDVFWMWRVILPDQLAGKLGTARSEIESEDLFERLFPMERSLFFVSDRF